MNASPDITIIGGGMTGLAAAWFAAKRGLRVRLVESSDRLGGKITSERVTDDLGDWLVEGGPDSFLVQKPEGLNLCRDLGLESDFLDCTPTDHRVCILNRDLLPIPDGARLFIPVDPDRFRANELLSAAGTERALAEIDVPPREEQGDESLADFATRRFGAELLDKLAGPVLAGIYGASPDRLSVAASFGRFHAMEQKHGSLIRALANQPRRSGSLFTTLRCGMERMVDALAERLHADPNVELLLGECLTALPSSADASLGRILLAIPAAETARLVPELDEHLADFRTVSTATVSLAYAREDAESAKGYGFMSVLSDPSPLVGCTFVTNKFAGRSPDGGFLVRAFIGGQKSQADLDRSDDELAALVHSELAHLVGFTGTPRWHRVQRWRNGNPQYDVGHLDRVAALEAAARHHGVELIGSPFRGVGLSDCIRSAEAAVRLPLT